MLPARDPPRSRRDEARPRRRAELGREHYNDPGRGVPARRGRPRPRQHRLDPQVLDDLRERYDTAVSSGLIHNRLRDRDTGNHPGYVLARWLRDYKEQVFLYTRDFNVDWTNNVSERGDALSLPPATDLQIRLAAAARELRRRGHPENQP